MTADLRPVEQPLRWGRLETRSEIAVYVAERREVLSRLCREEGLGKYAKPEVEQLDLWQAAA
jgi:hypothetical protein